jgi:hypothetical protein
MSASPDWQKHAVNQRRPATGCIPTTYEMMLRAANVAGIDFASFQDDFDLDKNGGAPKNHLVSVGKAVQAKYPSPFPPNGPFKAGSGRVRPSLTPRS